MQKLKTFRVLCGLTQNEMAEILGIRRTTYVQKEAGITADFTRKEVNIILKTFEAKGHKATYEEIFMED